ncbi:MFS transporter [Bradyrhizobium sp. AC87j1]|uniref:MFS transporter n=1 Tax=Bradyrhizobium sp. AC87j1 TaxID=2055894 RepID=UPI000CEC45A1|nr:MFS transporter [Bradyrhizobium sp. AC87j1]PPQ16454.1 MFS transporter [Bradyrhizobium sp. AC87j1]
MEGETSSQSELWRGRNLIAGCLLGMMMSVSSIYFYTAGLFLKPLAAEFGWTRGMASLGPLVGILTIGVASPFAGRLVDRFGALRMALLSAAGLAFSFLALGIATEGLVSFLLLTLVLAILGSATTPVSYGRMVVGNFPRRLGLVYGIVYCGPGLAALMFPSLVGRLLGAYGWRGAYMGLAALTLGTIPIITLLLKSQAGREKSDPGATKRNWGLYVDRRFMLLAAIFLLASTGIFGTIVHFVPMLTDRGIAPATAVGLAGLIGFAVIAGRLITGFLLDIVETNLLAAAIFLLSACGVLMLASGSPELILPGTLAMGFTIGSEFDLALFLVGRRFPPSHFSTLFGGIYLAVSIGGGGGPILAGTLYDRAGNYLPWFAVAVTCLLVAFALCLVGRFSVFRDRAIAPSAA